MRHVATAGVGSVGCSGGVGVGAVVYHCGSDIVDCVVDIINVDCFCCVAGVTCVVGVAVCIACTVVGVCGGICVSIHVVVAHDVIFYVRVGVVIVCGYVVWYDGDDVVGVGGCIPLCMHMPVLLSSSCRFYCYYYLYLCFDCS